jgi:hypothetical protein
VNFYLKTFILVLILSLTAFGVHSWWIENPVISLIKTYTFLGGITVITICIFNLIFKYSPGNLGYSFLLAIVIKCGITLLLFPELIIKDYNLSIVDVLGFLIPYFIFLFIEVVLVIKWLNNN